MCLWQYVIGVLSSSSPDIYSRYFCKCSKFPSVFLGRSFPWNDARKDAAIPSTAAIRSFDKELSCKLNDLHQKIHGTTLVDRETPNKYTGEVIGVEYLFNQCNMSFGLDCIDKHIDDGLVLEESRGTDSGFEEPDLKSFEPGFSNNSLLHTDNSDGSDEDADVQENDDLTSVDSKGIQGWGKVDELAEVLVGLRGLSITTKDAKLITELYDKKPLVYQSVVKKHSSGRFARRKRRSGHVGIVVMKRCFVNAGSPALPPSRSRLVEAICIHLCADITKSFTWKGDDGKKRYDSRWKLILVEYNKIRARLFNSQALIDHTNLTLFNINETSLNLCFKNKIRREEILTLMQGKNTPGSLTVSKQPLLPPRDPPQ